AVEIDVQDPEGKLLPFDPLHLPLQPARQGNAAGADADEHQRPDLAVALDDLVRDARQRAVDLVGVQDAQALRLAHAPPDKKNPADSRVSCCRFLPSRAATAATFPVSRTGLKARRIAEAVEEYPTPVVLSTASIRSRRAPGRYIGPLYVAFLFWMRIS